MSKTVSMTTGSKEIAFLVEDILYALKGVENVETWKLLTGYEIKYRVVVSYDEDVIYLTSEQVADFVEYAQEDYVGLFMWLESNGMTREDFIF